MSDTPRNDETPEYRDPTAPSDGAAAGDSSTSGDSGSVSDHTSPIDTNQTQEVPPVPPAPAAPSAAPGAQPGGEPSYGPPPGAAQQNPYAAPPAGGSAPPPPHDPYAGAPGAGQPNPYASQQYPTQGQVQGGYAGAPTYGAPGYSAPGYGGTYAAPQSLSGSTIALLVVSGLTTLGCGFGIVGLIFAIIAAAKKDQPADSAKYTRWGWIAVAAGFVLSILAVVAFFVLVASTGSSSSFDSGY
jgi:hypothetical protein